MTAPLVAVDRVDKRLGGAHALRDVSLALHPGTVVGIVGKNGAGKSTLIKVLAGVHRPDSGTVSVDGQEVVLTSPQDAAARGLFFVFQETTLVPKMTVEENITLGRPGPRRAGVLVDRRHRESAAGEALRTLGLDLDLRTPVERLGVAHQRMVMIARGLVGESRLLVLDEPSASLTDEEIVHLHEVVRALRDEGLCVVYISHRVDEVLSLSDRVVVMRDGQLVDDRPTSGFDRRSLVAAISQGADGVVPDVLDRRAAERPARTDGEVVLTATDLHADSGVRGVSLTVRRGEVLGIAGLVGSRRTELVRLLYGADPLRAGTITIRGAERRLTSPRAAMRAGVVMVPEDRRLQGNIVADSIRSNVLLPNLRGVRRMRRAPFTDRARADSAVAGIVTRLRLKSNGPRQPVAELSGGNQQKVVIAKWLLHDGEVFVFDEPAVGVDVAAKAEIFALLRELAEAGKGVVLISSDFSEIVDAADRVVVLREGRLVAELQRPDIREDTILEHCYGAA